MKQLEAKKQKWEETKHESKLERDSRLRSTLIVTGALFFAVMVIGFLHRPIRK